MNKLLMNVCSKMLYILFFIIIFIVFLSRFFISIQFSIFGSQLADAKIFYFFNFYTLIAFLIIILMMKRKIKNIFYRLNNKKLYILYFLIPVIYGFIFLFIFGYGIGDDALSCYNVANLLNNGVKLVDLDSLNNYLKIVPYQYGFVNVLRLFIAIFEENSIFAYQVFQIILYGVANVYLFRIKNILSNDKNSNLALLVLNVFWIIPYMISPYVYGFALGFSFAIISLYYFLCFIKTGNYYLLIISLTLVLFSTYIKMNYTIVIIAYVLYIIVFYDAKIFKKIILSVSTIFCLVLSLNIVYLSAKIIDDYYLPKGSTLLSWLVMGSPDNTLFDEDSNYVVPGYFTGYAFEIAEKNNYITSEINKEVYNDLNKVIKYTINNPKKAIKYYYYKFISTWDVADFNTFYYVANHGNNDLNNDAITSLDNGTLNIFFTQVINIGTVLLLFGSIIYIYMIARDKQKNDQSIIVIILWFIGGWMYHLLFETKGIYIYPYLTILIPISSIGISFFLNNNFIENNILCRKNICILIVGCIIATIIFNRQKFVIPFYESYADAFGGITTNNSKIEYIVSFKNNTKINKVELQYLGRLNDDKAKFEIYENNKLVYQSDITQEVLDNNPSWIIFEDMNLNVEKNNNYNFMIKVYGKNNDFNIIVGPSQWAEGKTYVEGNLLENYVINIKLFETKYSKIYYYQNIKDEFVNNLYYRLW